MYKVSSKLKTLRKTTTVESVLSGHPLLTIRTQYGAVTNANQGLFFYESKYKKVGVLTIRIV